MSKNRSSKKQATHEDKQISSEGEKECEKKQDIKRQLSINSENFVMCRVGNFD
jgi:hypothetical protein